MSVRVRCCAIATALLLVAADVALPAEKPRSALYRYRDHRGVLVVNDHVPPEFIRNGYQVITRDGRVIEEVAPQLEGEAAARARAAAAEQQRLKEWDESLLRRYSTTADIEAARERALREFDIRISILRSNLQSVKGQIEREQARAADIERRGQNVPEELARSIADLRAEVVATEEMVALRQRERAEVQASYQRDIERFETLKEVLEARRRGYGDDS
jgi:chromosome segregation ATPase